MTSPSPSKILRLRLHHQPQIASTDHDGQNQRRSSACASEELAGGLTTDLHTTHTAVDEQLPQTQVDSDTTLSELTDLSDLSEADITETPVHPTESQVVAATTHHIGQMDNIGSTSEEDVPSEQLTRMAQSSDSDARSLKRMKTNNGKKKSVALASTEATTRKTRKTPASTTTQLTILPRATTKPDKPGAAYVSTKSASNANLPSRLSSSPQHALEQTADHQAQAQITTERPSLKMTIVSKAEYDAVKSFNSILSSHNLSLARHNTILRRENADAVASLEEIKDAKPLDHSGCVLKSDYQEVVDENDMLRTDITQLRYEHQLMKECGMEWARRENIWDVEKPLLKQEVTDLMNKVGQLEANENVLVARVRELEGRTKDAEKHAEAKRLEVLNLQERVRVLHGLVNVLQAQIAQNAAGQNGGVQGSVYPEL